MAVIDDINICCKGNRLTGCGVLSIPLSSCGISMVKPAPFFFFCSPLSTSSVEPDAFLISVLLADIERAASEFASPVSVASV